MVQNQPGRSGASQSPSRPASGRPAREMSSGCRAESVSRRRVPGSPQPGGDKSWGYRIGRSIAVPGSGSTFKHAIPQHDWGLWGGWTHWAPQQSLTRCGGFPLAETSCAATEFRCRDGSCIGNSSRCNQFIDCEDASDEMNCSECPSCCPVFPAASPALPRCSSGDAPALCVWWAGAWPPPCTLFQSLGLLLNWGGRRALAAIPPAGASPG